MWLTQANTSVGYKNDIFLFYDTYKYYVCSKFLIVITVSRYYFDDHKTKWSRHRPFLYGCDRSPGVHVLKLGTEIPN